MINGAENWRKFAPNSPDLLKMLAEWPGREFAYAHEIQAVDCLKCPERPMASVIAHLRNPDVIDPASWRALSGAADVELIVLRQQLSPIPFEILTALADIAILVGADCSPGTARNIGAIFSSAPVLVFLSDFLAPDYHIASAFADCLQSGAKAARGRIILKKNEYDRRGFDSGPLSRPRMLDMDECVAARRAEFMSVGGFDEALPDGFLGVDLGIRIAQAYPGPHNQYYCGAAVAHFSSFCDFIKTAPADSQLFDAKYRFCGESAAGNIAIRI